MQRLSCFFLMILALAGVWTSGCQTAAPYVKTQTSSFSETVARIGNEVITRRELDAASQEAMKPLETQIYEIKKTQLNKMINEKLWNLAAKDRKMSREELQSKVAGDPEQFTAKLWKDYSVQIFLNPPRFEVNVRNSPMRGNPKASVTITEYSDFECPFCRRFQPILKEIMEKYGDKVNFAFKHFPLPFHKKARLAHMASLCAEEQGKFWEYRDLLFADDQGLEREELMKDAERAGVSLANFSKCLDEERHADKIDRDIDEARQLGVQGTPTFFINGRLLSGAQPFYRFAQIIDDELSRKR